MRVTWLGNIKKTTCYLMTRLTRQNPNISYSRMVKAMELIWESDFHTFSYDFRPVRIVHHAIHSVKLQLTDCGEGD